MEENEKPYNKLQWIFYIVLVPTIFTLLLTGIIFTFLGYNVVDSAISFAQKIPGVSTIFPPNEEVSGAEQESQPTEPTEEDVQASANQDEIKRLEAELEQKDMEILSLEQQLGELRAQQEQELITREERDRKIRELAQLYGGMSASRSAAVLEKLTLKEAAQIINAMNNQQRTAIMGKLNPSFAAQLTVVMKELDTVDDPDLAALQERVQILMGMLDASMDDPEAGITEGTGTQTMLPINNMVNTFSQMPPAQAAAILERMSNTESEFKLAAKILAVMSDEVRSAIFAAMETEIAIKYTNELAS